MRISSTGSACASFAAMQAEMDGQILDNGTLVASNAVATDGAVTSGSVRYSQVIEITSEPDALGRIPVMAGQLLLVPRISGSGFLQFLDPATGVVTTTALAIPSYVAATNMYSCGVTLPNGIVQLVPWLNTQFAHYDPWAHTLIAGITHGRTSSAAVPAFSGAAVGKDGLVYYAPGHAADKAVCSYNYASNTLAVTTMVLPYGADWQTLENGGSVIPLPDGDLAIISKKAADLGAPWRIKPSVGTVTNCTRTSTTSASTMLGAALSADGKYLVLAESIANKIRFYRLADNTLLDAIVFSSTVSNPWSAAILIHNGQIALIGNGHLGFALVDPVSFKIVMGTVAASQVLTVTANFADGETVTAGAKTYTFKAALTNTNGFVAIGVDAATSLQNLAAAINLGAGAGSAYALSMSANADASAVATSGTTLTATAITMGTPGNTLATTETGANASWGAATMTGGVNLGSFAGVAGAASGSGSNTVGGRPIGNGKVQVLPGLNLSNFFTWQPFMTGALPEGVRKSRYADRKS